MVQELENPTIQLDDDLLEAVRRTWGHDRLLPLQAEAIGARLAGRDSLVVLSRDMLRFLDHAGFELGRNVIVDCSVHAGRLTGNGTEALGQAVMRTLEEFAEEEADDAPSG